MSQRAMGSVYTNFATFYESIIFQPTKKGEIKVISDKNWENLSPADQN